MYFSGKENSHIVGSLISLLRMVLTVVLRFSKLGRPGGSRLVPRWSMSLSDDITGQVANLAQVLFKRKPVQYISAPIIIDDDTEVGNMLYVVYI